MHILRFTVKSHFFFVCYKLNELCPPKKNQFDFCKLLFWIFYRYQTNNASWNAKLCYLHLAFIPQCNWTYTWYFKLFTQDNLIIAPNAIYVFLISPYFPKYQCRYLHLTLWFTLCQLDFFLSYVYIGWQIIVILKQMIEVVHLLT